MALLALVLPPAIASAQLTTDQVPFQRTVPADTEVHSELERSRLRLGPLRILPWLSIRNFGYDNNVFGSSQNPVGDYTATVGAGARIYLPVGSKTFLRLDALPEYTWYLHLSQRDRWAGRGELAYLAFFNHVSLRLSGAYVSSASSLLTSEVPALVVRNGWDGQANAEVDLTGRISMFAGAEVLSERVKDQGSLLADSVNVATFNRTDGVVRAGFRYHFSPAWNVSIGAEATETRFVLTPELRNNRGVAPLFGLHYDRPRLFINLYAGYRIGQPLDGSLFPAFETPTGSAYVSYLLTKNLDLQAFGLRRLVYGSTASIPYYVEGRVGGGVDVHILSHITLGAYGSYGTDNYGLATEGSGTPARLDQVTTFGATLTLGIWRSLMLTARADRVSYDSNVPSFNRTVFTVLTGLSFGLEYAR